MPSSKPLMTSSSSSTPTSVESALRTLETESGGINALAAALRGPLGEAARIVLELPKAREACPHNLAPTTSSLMQAAIGDALAIALLEGRGDGADAADPDFQRA